MMMMITMMMMTRDDEDAKVYDENEDKANTTEGSLNPSSTTVNQKRGAEEQK